MTAAKKLPRSVEEITPAWLTEALSVRQPGTVVAKATTEKILWGTATKILLEVEYASATNLPRKLCVKGEFDEKLRQQLSGVTTTGTQIEAEFYNDLGPTLGVPLPRHWYGGSEPGMGVLILDNLAATNTRFGTPTEPWSPDLVAKGLDILARLHASTWGKTFPAVPWLKIGTSPNVRMYLEFLMSDAHWREHFVKPEVFKLPRALADRERSLKALRAMYRYGDEHPQCLVHGDTHLGNTCIDASGQPYFIDWAGPSISPWAVDVPYFITGALTVTDRRANERDLFHYYLGKLEANGGPALDRADAWDDYRRHGMQGMGWCTLPPTMQPNEFVHAMGERYATAMVDHDTLGMLGV